MSRNITEYFTMSENGEIRDKNTHNIVMKGTNEYNNIKKAFEEKRSNKKVDHSSNLKKELKSLKKAALIKKFHEMVDPDRTENVSGLTKDEIIERIHEFASQFGGRKRRNRTRRHRKHK